VHGSQPLYMMKSDTELAAVDDGNSFSASYKMGLFCAGIEHAHLAAGDSLVRCEWNPKIDGVTITELYELIRQEQQEAHKRIIGELVDRFR
jgi:hypothetical protein